MTKYQHYRNSILMQLFPQNRSLKKSAIQSMAKRDSRPTFDKTINEPRKNIAKFFHYFLYNKQATTISNESRYRMNHNAMTEGRRRRSSTTISFALLRDRGRFAEPRRDIGGLFASLIPSSGLYYIH